MPPQSLTEPPTPLTRDALITSLLDAAAKDGLTPVVEGDTVDLRIRKGNRVVAAIRVHLDLEHTWYEAPARVGVHSGVTVLRQPWANGLFRPEHMRDLDLWWARVPETGRTWRMSDRSWTKPGYWRSRLGVEVGVLARFQE